MAGAGQEGRLSSDHWRIYVMLLWGRDIPENLARCPETASAISPIPKVHTALFSILDPRAEIPRHRGWAAGVGRCHYPLLTARDPTRCWIDVGSEHLYWREGVPVLFDDTLQHEVHNETEDLRVVLIVDFEPRLPALPHLYAALRYQLVSRSEEIREIARRSVVQM